MGKAAVRGNTSRIRELLAAGWKPPEIAREIGVSRERVYQINRDLAAGGFERGDVKRRIVELLDAHTNHQIAIELGCAERYVGLIRAEAGIVGPRAPRPMYAPKPQDAPTIAQLVAMGQPFVDDGPVEDEAIELDGATLTIEPASAGRALLSLREDGSGAAVARVTRAQLSRVIERMQAARDALPEVAA